jgi:ribonuclease E
LARNEAATRKRKSTRRKKKVKAAESATPAEEGGVTEQVIAATEASAAEEPRAAEAKTSTSTAKRRRSTRRSKKKVAAAGTSAPRAEAPVTETPVTEAPAEAASPAPSTTRKKKARRRRTAKKRHAQPTASAANSPQAPAPPAVKPVSPMAEVEQSEDTIVIRFPSPPNDDDHASQPPTVDAEKPATVAGPQANQGTGPAAPSKRRRRRRKRDPRVAPGTEPPKDRPETTKEDRLRPEPTDVPGDAVEPATAATPAQHRRKRSRRAKKRGAVGGETPPVSQESEDLSEAPVPAGQKEMIINVAPHEECRIAIMEAGKLQEIYLERASSENQVGNIYKGIVTNVEPSIQAAFIDFGQGKNGFLHISDLHPQYFPNGDSSTENVGRKTPRRNRPPIQRCLRRGQQLLVQITKEGIGTKGPTLTSYLSIPGRFLVMMPGMRQLGVSRKIEDDDTRRKLRDQLNELNLPEDAGFIARTAALGRTKRELQSDLNYLSRLWKSVDKRIKSQKAPTEIYTESDLVIRTIRDVYSSDINRIVVDDADVAKRADEFLSVFSPRSRDTVVHYEDPEPIFHRYGIENELERLHSRHVPLKSGGSLVIDQTEALVAIDVNSGRFRAEDDAEITAYKIDLEAADEIPRQLRLRDLGGVVICDFIDVRQEKHKREIERRLNRNLKQHKERAKILRMSEFGIIELTRQRQRASLTRNVYQDCQHCHGSGLVKTPESVTLDVMRLIQLAVTKKNIRSIEVSVSGEVAHLLQNRKREALHNLEAKHRRTISIRTRPEFGLDQIQLTYCDQRGRVIPHP